MKRVFSVLICTIALALSVCAQDLIVGGMASYNGSHGLGYKPISYGGEGFIDWRVFKKVSITNQFNFEAAHKIDPGDGFLIADRFMLRVGDRYWAGAGFEANRQTTSEWTKVAFRPAISVGAQFADHDQNIVRPYVTYFFPDSTAQHTRGIRAGVLGFLPVGEKWGVITRAEFSFLRFVEPWGHLNGETISVKGGIYRRF